MPWRFDPPCAPRPPPELLLLGCLAGACCACETIGPHRGVVEVDKAPGEVAIESGELMVSTL